MDFTFLKSALATAAPTLATMLGGPLAGAAVTALEGAFGLPEGSGADAITKVVQAGGMTPDVMAAVRAADQKHQEMLGQQGVDLAKINADHEAAMQSFRNADVADARHREVEVKDNTPAILAGVVTLGFFGILAFMLLQSPPAASKDILNVMLGSLGTAWVAIVSYYFGSSAGSARKTDLLAQAEPITK